MGMTTIITIARNVTDSSSMSDRLKLPTWAFFDHYRSLSAIRRSPLGVHQNYR
ncbi:hypothetical protein HAX54_030405, partial [Datura stramonium]|nr:hypothetical protein [Datura stramonium]